MSKRLQVVLDDAEYRDLKRVARGHGLTLSQWVRQALRRMRRQEADPDVERKLKVIREAVKHEYPTADIDQMLREIDKGRNEELD